VGTRDGDSRTHTFPFSLVATLNRASGFLAALTTLTLAGSWRSMRRKRRFTFFRWLASSATFPLMRNGHIRGFVEYLGVQVSRWVTWRNVTVVATVGTGACVTTTIFIPLMTILQRLGVSVLSSLGRIEELVEVEVLEDFSCFLPVFRLFRVFSFVSTSSITTSVLLHLSRLLFIFYVTCRLSSRSSFLLRCCKLRNLAE